MNKILRIVALLLILVNLSSCFQGKWQKYRKNTHYIKKGKKYQKYHSRRNGDW
ncbi:MAG: hypothetical protein K0Q79_1588 [Flavipsychrobacter sp.]|nr:hypothetical protein [Flavipsychrobacter sp.]